MAKRSGLTWTVHVDDSGGTERDLEENVLSMDFSTPRGVQDVTAISSSAMERLLLLADFTINLTMVYDDQAVQGTGVGPTGSHAIFETVPSTAATRTVTLTHVGTSDVLPNEVIFTDYAFTRAADGSMTTSAPGLLNSTTVPTWA